MYVCLMEKKKVRLSLWGFIKNCHYFLGKSIKNWPPDYGMIIAIDWFQGFNEVQNMAWDYIFFNGVDGSEIRRENHRLDVKNLVNNGTNYQPQLVFTPDFWTINSIPSLFLGKYSHGVRVKTRNLGFIRVFFWPLLSLNKAKFLFATWLPSVIGELLSHFNFFVYNDEE